MDRYDKGGVKARAKKVLKATIFGRFSLTNGTVTLREEDIQSNKLVQVLVYMISHRDITVTRNRLSEQFWSDNSKNPESALKNLMYRLRNMLKIMGPEEYICTKSGGYRWNPEIPVETDYEQLEEISGEIKKQPDGPARKELCRKLIACYRGEISAKLACELWLQPQIIQYQTAYLNTSKILCDIYERESEWEELEKLCRKVVEQEPLDEDIQSWLVKSLQKQKKYDQALSQYESAKKQFYKNLGIGMPEKLQEIFQEVVTGSRMQITNISGIMKEAVEKEEPSGVFFCDYQIFRQIYRLEMRRVDRIGISEYILLLTVRRVGSLWERNVTDTGLTESVAILEQVIRENLRMGDVAARNGPVQYVILLSACSYEAGMLVIKRIQKNFLKKVKYRKVELEYELEEVSFQWEDQEKREEQDDSRELYGFPV